MPRNMSFAMTTEQVMNKTKWVTRRFGWWFLNPGSATIVWGVLYEMGLAENTVMFNAVPWHPEGNKGPFSNRTPTTKEKKYGRAYLNMFLGLYPRVPVVALGNTASGSLSEVGIEHIKVRHPANGGARKFREGIKQFLESGLARLGSNASPRKKPLTS